MERFWNKVEKTKKCWLWTGALDSSGYGKFWLNGPAKAHRVAFELTFGQIPAGFHVMHICDDSRCVNPSHLVLGTNATNMADRTMKGRQAKGEKINTAKLTSDQVINIRTSYEPGRVTQKMLATKYGVSESCINAIINRQRWAHV